MLACLSAGALSGCSPSAPDSARALPALPSAAARIAGRLRVLAPLEEELRRRTDPRQGTWRSEAIALAIESAWAVALEQFLRGDARGEAALRALLAPDFGGASELCAAERACVFDDGTLRVEEPAAGSVFARARPEEFPAQLARWKQSLGGLGCESLLVQVDALEFESEALLSARLCLRVAARSGESALQQNLVWDTRWRAGADAGAPRLVSLDLARAQVVRAAGAVFRERTREVFGALACWPEELARGAIEYHLHQDRLSRLPFVGMHGLAVGDLDGDGIEDVYLPQPGGQPNRLFLRQKDGSVREAAREAGLALLDNTGPAIAADLDGDGDEDLALGLLGNLQLCWNDGTGHFTLAPLIVPRDPAELFSLGAADVDNDGDLDLFACRYIAGGIGSGTPVPYCDAENGAGNLFWRNEGGHVFREALAEIGLAEHSERFSLALWFEDLDEDGWVDLYVVNDFGRSTFYRNEHGRFRDVGRALGLSEPAAGMGVDLADVDGDGRREIYTTNMHSPAGRRITRQPAFMAAHPQLRADYAHHAHGNALLRAGADGRYTDQSDAAGVAAAGWGWGARFVDWSNGGWPGLFVPNGFVSNRRHEDLESFFWREVIARSPAAPPASEEYEKAYALIRYLNTFEGWSWSGWQRKYAYLNLRDGRFADVSAATALDYLDDARAVDVLDWDEDGRLDLLVRNRTAPRLRLLLGAQTAPNHFLELSLSSPGPNRDAIGASVRVEAGGRSWQQSVRVSAGYLCGASRRLHFGLGAATRAERVRVRWPDGTTAEFRDLAADARYRLVQGREAELRERSVVPAAQPTRGERIELVPGNQSRIVLFDELPVEPLALPRFSGAAERVADHAGHALVLTVASAADARSRAWLERWAQRTAELDALGARQRIVLLDDARTLDSSRAELARLGLLERCGAATQAFRDALQVFLVETLGPFPELDQPLELVIDRGGRLAVLWTAPDDLARVLDDVRTAASTQPNAHTSESFLGGTWVQRGARNVEKLEQVFRSLGQDALSQRYGELARAKARR